MPKNKKSQQTSDCRPGSIKQQLDMCETGPLRGDEILRDHTEPGEEANEMPEGSQRLDQIVSRYYEENMAEESREGDEMTGDDHSAGLQGEETEVKGQKHIRTGLPGEFNEDKEDTTAA